MRLVDCFCDIFAFILTLPDNQEQYPDAHEVQKDCLQRIEEARQCAMSREYNKQQFETALFAVIVWIDETILCSDLAFIHDWTTHQLQFHFFDINNGGDEFYKRLDAIDHQDTQLLEVFAYCLAFGFHGRLYGDRATLEKRRAKLNTTCYRDSSPSDKLFPAGYRSGTDRNGYTPPRIHALRSFIILLLPLSMLIGTYFILFHRLDTHMR